MGLFSSLFGGKKSSDKEIDAPYPSWAGNEVRMKEHLSMIKAGAKLRSIPEYFVGGLYQIDYSINKLLFVAGLMEMQGASFEVQTLAVLDHIERHWSNMDSNDKQTFIDKS